MSHTNGRLAPRVGFTCSGKGKGKVVTLTCRPPLPPEISWYSFLEAESTPGHTEKCQLPQNKFQASPFGIDPGSFRLVA